MNQPIVSVIMPCFNHGRYIRESISAILAQSFSDFELIVIDDGSTDSSVQEVMQVQQSDARVHLLRHTVNFGPSRSRNDGIAASRGQFLAFCDADDTWMPEKLQQQMTLLQSRPDCGLTYCDAEIIDETGAAAGQRFSDLFPPSGSPTGNLFAALCASNFINTQAVLARRDLLAPARWFDEHMRCNEDWWLWLRLSRLTRFVYEPTALAKYRIHSMSTSRTQSVRYKRDLWRMCKQNLRSYPSMARHLQGLMWYQMGFALCSIGKRDTGRPFMWRGLCDSIFGAGSISRILRMAVRCVQANFGLPFNLRQDGAQE